VTTADVFIPEVWSAEAIVARQQKLLFAEKVNRKFEKDVMSFGDLIHVPSVSHLGVTSKNTSANAATVYETITETNTDITVGTWHYSAIALETATKRQTNRDLLKTYAPEMGYALGLAIDDVLAGLPDNFSQVAGTLISELTYEDMLFAIQQLDDANAPQEDRVIIISPAQKAGFMKLDQFVHSDYSKLNGESKAAVKDSYMGTWMNIPVHFSTNVEGSNAAGHDNTIFQKEALALVVQMKPTTHTAFDIDYFAHKVTMEQLSGSAEMRDDHGVWLKGA
jgi:hypothetical protein